MTRQTDDLLYSIEGLLEIQESIDMENRLVTLALDEPSPSYRPLYSVATLAQTY